MVNIQKVVKLLRITRMHIVLGGFLAFIVGGLLGVAAGGSFNPFTMILFYAIVLFGDLSTHYSNDYYDVNEDKLIGHRKIFSGRKILVNNQNLLPLARWTSLGFLVASISLAVLAVTFGVAGFELLIIAVGANFLGWFYSAPPLRLVSRGLGEVTIALAAGFAIPAVGYLAAAGKLDGFFGFFVLPFILYGFMLALSLEAPDIEVDSRGDKKNVGVRMGERAVFGIILAASTVAFEVFAFLSWQAQATAINFWVFTALAAIPLASGILGYICVLRKRKMDTFSAVNVATLFIFNFLTIVYLSFLLL